MAIKYGRGKREKGHSTLLSASRHTGTTKRQKRSEVKFEPLEEGEEVKLTVFGEPVAKARPRVTRQGVFTPTKTHNAENTIALLYKSKYGGRGFGKGIPLYIKTTFYMQIAKSEPKKTRLEKIMGRMRPTKVPDIENLAKTVYDALNQVAYYDDSQIVDAEMSKVWSENPRIEILIKVAGEKKDV